MKSISKIFIASLVVTMFCTTFVFAGEWVQDGTNWKYKEDDGTFAVSKWKFLKIKDDYKNFYFDENGYMCTGIKRIGEEVYAFNDDGTTMSKSSVYIDGEEYTTGNRGLVEGISNAFDVDEYNARMEAIRASKAKELEDAKAKAEEEKRRIAESIANMSEEEKAYIAASQAKVKEESIAKEESIKAEMAKKVLESIAKEEAAEAERIARLNNTMRISKTLPDAVVVEGENNGKVTISVLIPTLIGGNSDQINAILASKIKNAVYILYESKYGMTTSKLTFKTKKVNLYHNLDEHTLTFTYLGDNDYPMFRLYMDTVTLEMWSD